MKFEKTPRRVRWLAPTGLALALGLAFDASAALAPACNGVASQPESVRIRLTANLGVFFPLDEKTCEDLTKKAIDACHKAVSDAQKCVADLSSNIRKTSKPVCAAQGSEKKACDDSYKALNEDQVVGAKNDALAANDVCDGEFADAIFEACINGLPHE